MTLSEPDRVFGTGRSAVLDLTPLYAGRHLHVFRRFFVLSRSRQEQAEDTFNPYSHELKSFHTCSILALTSSESPFSVDVIDSIDR